MEENLKPSLKECWQQRTNHCKLACLSVKFADRRVESKVPDTDFSYTSPRRLNTNTALIAPVPAHTVC